MIKDNEEKYIVLEHDSYSGLTLGSYSRKPGTIFYRSQCKLGDDELRNIIAGKRIKLFKEDKKKVKNNDSK